MMPLKTSQFAEIIILAEPFEDQEPMTTEDVKIKPGPITKAVEVKVGIASNLRISENLGSNQRNVIGTPVPVFVPGFYQGSISLEKATFDLKSFKTMANLNPFMAYRPDSYNGYTDEGKNLGAGIDVSETEVGQEFLDSRIPRFLFGLYVYDTIQDAHSKPTGLFLCMLQSYNTSLTVNDAVIMEDVSLLARPVSGSWFAALRDYYEMSPMFGYTPYRDPQRSPSGRRGGSDRGV